MSGRRRPALGELRTYVAAPTQPYFIAEAPGEEPLTSASILDIISTQALVAIERTALDIGQVLMRSSYEKSIASMRNLVKETLRRYERRTALAFLMPAEAKSDADDEVLRLVVAILQDTDGEHSSRELVEQTSREDMSPV